MPFKSSLRLQPVVASPPRALGPRIVGPTGRTVCALLWGVSVAACSPDDPGPRAQVAAPVPVPSPPDGAILHREVLSVADADRHGSTWFVLDTRDAAVHRVGPDGALLGSFGRRGEGPGEFESPEKLVVHGDTIVVWDQNQLRLFTPAGEHIADWSLHVDECAAPLPLARGTASLPIGILLLVDCVSSVGLSPRVNTMAWLVEGDGESRALAHYNPPAPRSFGLDFVSSPAIAAHPRGFLFGKAADDCLAVHGLDGSQEATVCHDWLERPQVPPDMAERLAETSRRTGLNIPEMESLAPFTDVFVTGSGGLVYVTLVVDDEGELWQQLRSHQPDAWENGPDSPTASMLFGSGDAVLAVWEDLDGTRIAVYDLAAPSVG